MRHTMLAVIVLCAALAAADGIPVRNGKIDVPHTIIDLTESQAEEVEVLGTLTFTDQQWSDLRKIGSGCPKRFEAVLPITYNDCTCGYYRYAILLTRKKAAVLHYDMRESELMPSGKIALRIDYRGQFYWGGSLVRFETLLKMLSTPEPPSPKDLRKVPRQISLEIADIDPDSPAIRERGIELQRAARAGQWEFNVLAPVSWEVPRPDDPRADRLPEFAQPLTESLTRLTATIPSGECLNVGLDRDRIAGTVSQLPSGHTCSSGSLETVELKRSHERVNRVHRDESRC